jgi:RimJ/RimL family protein N-acetyltransferase
MFSAADQSWVSASPAATGRQLLLIPPETLSVLASGTLAEAQSLNAAITPYILSSECTGVWKMRVSQIETQPADAPWVTRLLVLQATGEVVGRAGFHGKPDERGMVEVGYSVDPAHRRRGHARAAMEILLGVARAERDVKVVRASVGPWNKASGALVRGFGFVQRGEQWDEEDGLEVVYELDL